jgi:hypothetical protein
MIELINWILE